MALRLRALDHVGILVSDLDGSLRCYLGGLGMEPLRRRGSRQSLTGNGMESFQLPD